MKPTSNRTSQAVRLAILLALLCFAFVPLFSQEAGGSTDATSAATSSEETSQSETAAQPAAEQPASQEAAPQPAATPAVASQPAAAQPALLFYDEAKTEDKAAVESSRALSASGKWLSAWKLLSDYDASNQNPWILAEKIRLADEGFAQSVMHLGFGFVDLQEGEDLESVRNGSGEGIDVVDFKPGDLAAAIEASGAALPPVLSLALGDYYYEVWSLYKGQWMEEDSVVLGKGAEQYERAFAYEAYTPESLGRQADILVALQRFDGAEQVVRKALELTPDSPALSLKLGDVLFGAGRYDEVYPIADELLAKVTDQNEVNDAYILAIKTGLSAGNRAALDKYLEGYAKAFPGEYMPGLVKHLVMVRLGDAEAANVAADALDDAFPGNPDVIRSVLSTWLSVGDTDSGFKYLERCLAKNHGNEASGALYFYKALLGYQAASSVEHVEAALADLATAEDYFKKVYPAEDQVFATVQQLRDQWNQDLTAIKAGQQEETTSDATAPSADTQPANAAQPAATAGASAGTTDQSSGATDQSSSSTTSGQQSTEQTQGSSEGGTTDSTSGT